MTYRLDPMDFYTEEIAICRTWDIPREGLSAATALTYFRDRGLLKPGCRTAVGEDEMGFYVKLWRWLPKTRPRLGRWKRKLNADSVGTSDVIDPCADEENAEAVTALHPLGLSEGQLMDAGNPLFGRASPFQGFHS